MISAFGVGCRGLVGGGRGWRVTDRVGTEGDGQGGDGDVRNKKATVTEEITGLMKTKFTIFFRLIVYLFSVPKHIKTWRLCLRRCMWQSFTHPCGHCSR